MATDETALAELAKVRDKIRETEEVDLPRLRTERDELICAARKDGAIGDELAEASGLSRQSVHNVLRDYRIPAPNRTRSAERRANQARSDLRRALVSAGLDPENVTAEAVRSALADPE
jgi:hypothetical protein